MANRVAVSKRVVMSGLGFAVVVVGCSVALDFDRSYPGGFSFGAGILPAPLQGERDDPALCTPFCEAFFDCLSDGHCHVYTLLRDVPHDRPVRECVEECEAQGGLTASQLEHSRANVNCDNMAQDFFEFDPAFEASCNGTKGDQCQQMCRAGVAGCPGFALNCQTQCEGLPASFWSCFVSLPSPPDECTDLLPCLRDAFP